MNSYTDLGFRLEPSGGGSDVFQKVVLIIIALLLLAGVFQLYRIRSSTRVQNAKWQKPIELQPNQYIVRGIMGIYSREKLMQLGLWRD